MEDDHRCGVEMEKKEESEKVRDKIGGLVRQQQDAELNISLKRLHAL